MRKNNTSMFLSYSWSDTSIADIIEKDLEQLQISFIRDVRDLKYKSSIKGFMEQIRDTNFSLMLISEKYLKSKNCMNEVIHLLKERDYEEKILPVIIGEPSIYDAKGRLAYTNYWYEEQEALKELVSSLPPTSIVNEIAELKLVENICSDINEFLAYISSINNISFENLKKEGYKSVLDHMGFDDVSHLIELLVISFIQDSDEKEIMIDQWFESNKPTSDAYSIRASTAKGKGNYKKAEINFEKALSLNPDNAFVLNNYGFMLMERNVELDKTKKLFEKAIDLMPKLTNTRLNLGVLLSSKFKDEESAKHQYKKIISYDPNEERAYNNLANIYKGVLPPHSKGRAKTICKLYKKAIKLNPNYVEAQIGYGNYLSEFTGEYDKAEKVFNTIIDIDPASKELMELFKERLSTLRNKKNDKTARNSLCPCGSNIKYKKCHGK